MLKLTKANGGFWFYGIEFANSHLVTDKNHNKELGISGIILKEPTTTGPKGNILASATILFENGLSVFGTVYVGGKSGNEPYFNTDQRKYEDRVSGEVRYADINVTVPSAIQAQVLRHTMTRVTEVAVQQAPQVAQMPQEQYQPEYQQQGPVAPVQPKQAAPSSAEVIQRMIAEGKTAEEIQQALQV